MAVCKIPFTLNEIFYYHDMPYLGFESISNEYIYGKNLHQLDKMHY
jgi:hypothetical protein